MFFAAEDELAANDAMNYLATLNIEDLDGKLLYITQTAQIVIRHGEVVTTIHILVEPIQA